MFTEVDGSRLPRDLFIVSKLSSQDFVLKILETENSALAGKYEITYGVGFANYPNGRKTAKQAFSLHVIDCFSPVSVTLAEKSAGMTLEDQEYTLGDK